MAYVGQSVTNMADLLTGIQQLVGTLPREHVSGTATPAGYAFAQGVVDWTNSGWAAVDFPCPAGSSSSSTSSSAPPSACCPVNITLNCPGATVGTPAPSTSSPGGGSVSSPGGGQIATTGNAKPVACLPAVGGVEFNNDGHSIARWLGLRDSSGNEFDVAKTFVIPTIVAAPINWLMWMLLRPVDFADVVFSKLLPEQGCTDPNYIQLQATRTVTGFMSKWVGPGLDGIDAKAAQQAHNLCPSMLPTPDNAIEAYLTDQISLDTATCWARAGDATEAEWRKMVDARQTKLNAGEVLALWRRKLIRDEQADKSLREIGYINPDTIGELKLLTDQIPPASDLVTFMVRDVEDPEILAKFNLDSQFDDKFQGKVKEWADNQGVSEEYMRRVWRAHWSIPAPTQLFDFYHRLRKDPNFGGEAKLRDEIELALRQQDILPFWVPYFMAASFHVPTRIDARRMYKQGVIDKAGLSLIFTRQGYSDEDANRLADFYETDRFQSWAKSPIVRQYVAGEINQGELLSVLMDQGATSPEVDRILAQAKLQQTARRRKVCHAAWRKKYLMGEMNADAALKSLIDDGLNADVAGQILAGWTCELKTRSKTIPAAKACQLYNDGIISEADYYQRLINVGYSNPDALALLSDCQLAGAKKRNAEQEKVMRRITQQAKAQDAANRRDQADAAKGIAASNKALEKARSISKMRRALLLETAFNYSNNSGEDPATSMELVTQTANQISTTTKTPLDAVLQAGPKVAKSIAVVTPADLSREWIAVLKTLQPV